MRDRVVWVPVKNITCEDGKTRTVYVKHWAVPFVGLMAAPDTMFSIPAYVWRRNHRVRGYVTPRDGMAFSQDHDGMEFLVLNSDAHHLGLDKGTKTG